MSEKICNIASLMASFAFFAELLVQGAAADVAMAPMYAILAVPVLIAAAAVVGCAFLVRHILAKKNAKTRPAEDFCDGGDEF